MFRNMANSVIEKEQVVTTVQKAKEVRRVVDRLITLAKSGTPHARRLAFDRTRSNGVVTKLFGTLADRYKARNGGYTRVLKLSDRRWGDAAEMAVIELVDHPELDRKRKPKAASEASAEAPATAQAKDSLSKMSKLFKGKSKVSGGAAKPAKAPKAPKTGASKRTMAGGGGSKAGGSSS